MLVSTVLYATANVLFLFLEGTILPPMASLPSPPSHPSARRDDFIFIGIKTSEAGIHGARLPEIEKAWLKNALETGLIDIRFFTHVNVNQTESSLMVSMSC